MASKISGSRKLKRKNLPKFEADLYTKIPSDGLIVFAVHYLIEHKIEITLEDIVSLCFLLFPHKFGLKKYPRWPDSVPISRHWGDVRRKRYVTANDYLGYRLTIKGTRLVKRVAKVLGVKLPKPIIKAKAVVVPAPVVKQAQKHEIKVQPVREEKATPPAPVKKARPVRVKKAASVPVVKQAQKPEIKAQVVQEERATPPAPVKKAKPDRTKKVVPAPAQVKQIQKPEIIQPIKVEKVQAEPVSREAKERAGKFTRMMERSDAYNHYKKNGSKSNISEFDFRSLLLCTMESSAETLARNVVLFKGYAGIYNRQDLIVFLTFCEGKFSHLLKPARKMKK